MYIYSRAGQILCIFTVELGNSRQLSLQRDNMLMANNGGYSCLVTLYVMAILFLLSGLINFSFRVVFISMLNNCRVPSSGLKLLLCTTVYAKTGAILLCKMSA